MILLYPINDSVWEGWHPVPHQGRISPLEEDAQTTPEVGDGLSLQLASVSGQCTSHLFHLSLSCGVPPSHRFVFALPSTMPHTIMSLPCRTQCPYIIISTFHNFNRISKFCQNFTILTELHNLDRISQFQQNFTILTEVHNYNRISQFYSNW